MIEGQKKELGNMIRYFRQTQYQLHNGHPWTQDDLAVAINSDKAHINRIENGKQIPTPQTLEKICIALNLDWKQKRRLMAQAGHLWALPPLLTEEAQKAVEYLEPHITHFTHPAVLQDKEAIMWYVNDLEAYTFYGYKNHEQFLDDCQGLRVIELLMTPAFNKWFEKIIINYEDYLRRQIMRFMDLYFPHMYSPEYQNILNHLLQISEFKKIWEELLDQENPKDSIVFLNHQILHINHPDIGRYDIQIWHCDISFDERLSLIQHVADTPDTQQLFIELWKRFTLSEKR